MKTLFFVVCGLSSPMVTSQTVYAQNSATVTQETIKPSHNKMAGELEEVAEIGGELSTEVRGDWLRNWRAETTEAGTGDKGSAEEATVEGTAPFRLVMGWGWGEAWPESILEWKWGDAPIIKSGEWSNRSAPPATEWAPWWRRPWWFTVAVWVTLTGWLSWAASRRGWAGVAGARFRKWLARLGLLPTANEKRWHWLVSLGLFGFWLGLTTLVVAPLAIEWFQGLL